MTQLLTPSPSLPEYRVRLYPPGASRPAAGTSYNFTYPVSLRDGSCLELPLRALPGGTDAIALLMSNQTPFAVEEALATVMTEMIRPLMPDMIVGVPTMGLDYARLVAKSLGLPHYVALGLSRKFWYDQSWSESTLSGTSPGLSKAIYLDPHLLDRVVGRRVVLIDDVINTGLTAAAALRLLKRAGARVEALAAVLTEGQAWRQALAQVDAEAPGKVLALGHIPMFRRVAEGWAAKEE